MKHLCACFVLLLLVFPALSVRDDEVRLANLLLSGTSHDLAISGLDRLSKDHGCKRALVDQLDHLKITPVSGLHLDTSFTILRFSLRDSFREPASTIREGRAPPAV
jgi:hypothetical protein